MIRVIKLCYLINYSLWGDIIENPRKLSKSFDFDASKNEVFRMLRFRGTKNQRFLSVKDELVGREVLDPTGHVIGKVDDVDVDFDSERISAIVLHEGGRLRGRERVIPFNMVETVGERVILKKESRMGEKSGGRRGSSMKGESMGRGEEEY